MKGNIKTLDTKFETMWILNVTIDELKMIRENAIIAYAVKKAFEQDVFATLAISNDSFNSLDDLLQWADVSIQITATQTNLSDILTR